MKKTVTTVFLLLLSIVLLAPIAPSAQAAKKKRTTKAKTQEEVVLDQLIKNRDDLIKAGASQQEIALANQCVEAQQAAIAAKKAQEEAMAQLAARLAGYQKTVDRGTKTPTTGVILVGDSRFVQMHQAVGDTGATFICENRMGYDWLVDNAIPRIDALATKGSKIVINLGVNDPGHIDKYISTVNNWAYTWTSRGAKVYYATVNPVWTNPYTSKEEVINFNQKLKNGLVGVQIIDTYDYLMNTTYRMVDGMHYDTPTSAAIYLYIMGSL